MYPEEIQNNIYKKRILLFYKNYLKEYFLLKETY